MTRARLASLLQIGITVAGVLLAPSPGEAQTTRNMTWDNAPPPAHKLYLTDEEFRGLFPEAKQAHAGYCLVPCTHNVTGKRPDGRPCVVGHWETDRKTGRTDYTYRPGRSTLEKGRPYFCHVTAYYRYAPPDAEQPRPVEDNRPLRRLDMTTLASVNAPYTLQSIREWKERDAKQRREQVRDSKSPYYKYRYVEDLGFGLDRNDMFVVLSTNGKSGQVHIQLNSAALWFYVRMFLHFEDGAVTPEQAVAIARNSAAIMAKKGFGAAAEIERGKDDKNSPGFTDAWVTDRPGATPEQDHHVSEIRLGQALRVACTYRLPQKPTDVEVVLFVIPGPDAIAASRDRCQRMPGASIQISPLESKAVKPGSGMDVTHLADGKQEVAGPVTARSHTDGQTVAYFTIPTDDIDRPFIIGPGAWEVEVVMRAYQTDPNDKDRLQRVELSKTRIPVTIADDPAFSAKILKPREKTPSDR